MAAKFAEKMSIHSTRDTASEFHPKEPKTSSYGAKGGNTMSGMPGFINAGQTKASGGMKGGKSISPKKEGPIGRKGGSGAKSMGMAKAAPGTTTKSYRSASTGSAGKMEKLKAPTSFESGGKRKSLMY